MAQYRPGIAILASGSGSTAEAFIHATQNGIVDADVDLIICNNTHEKAGIYDRVARLNKQYGLHIPVLRISGVTHPEGNVGRGQTLAESAAICERVSDAGVSHVALMGYMKQVRGELVEEYGWSEDHDTVYQARMTNTHPGPLPATADTYGIQASQRVLQLGFGTSAHTVHLVAEGIDTGPVLAEHEVVIGRGYTAQEVFDMVQVQEKARLPGVIDAFLKEQEAYHNGDS